MGTHSPQSQTQSGEVHVAQHLRFLSRSYLGALGAHAGFLVLFWALGVPFMVWVNICSVAIYACCLWLARINQPRPTILLLWLEISGHAIAATLIIGWASGFHYYVLLLAPLSFADPTRNNQINTLYTLLAIAIYIVLSFLASTRSPIAHMPEQVLTYLRYFNIAATTASLGLAASSYQTTVRDAEHELYRMASRDPLTQLSNRRHVTESMTPHRQNSVTGRPYAVMLLDIDWFKSINDRYGHSVGDAVLVEFSRLLTQHARQEDLIARWGGEEFLVVLPNTNLKDAQQVAERLRQQVEEHSFTAEGVSLRITVSLGVCHCDANTSLETSAQSADAALYRAKTGGRNRVEAGALLAEANLSQ